MARMLAKRATDKCWMGTAMPIVRVELLAGRSAEIKTEVAKQITETLERVAGIKPEATMVVFADVAPHDWVIAGTPLGLAPETSS